MIKLADLLSPDSIAVIAGSADAVRGMKDYGHWTDDLPESQPDPRGVRPALPDTNVNDLRSGDLVVQLQGLPRRVALYGVDETPRRPRSGALRLRPIPEMVEPAYLRWLLLHHLTRGSHLNGVDRPWRIDAAAILNLPVDLPSLAVQKDLSALLDRADRTRRLRDQGDLTRSRILPALYHALRMQGEGSSWPKRRLGDLAHFKPGGSKKDGQAITMNDHERPALIKIAGGTNKLVTVRRLGTHCGRVTLQPWDRTLTDAVWYVGSVSPMVDARYLAAALENANLRRYATSTMRPTLAFKAIEGLPIILPPIEAQMDFASQASRLDLLDDCAGMGSELLNRLWERLNGKAFAASPGAVQHMATGSSPTADPNMRDDDDHDR